MIRRPDGFVREKKQGEKQSRDSVPSDYIPTVHTGMLRVLPVCVCVLCNHYGIMPSLQYTSKGIGY